MTTNTDLGLLETAAAQVAAAPRPKADLDQIKAKAARLVAIEQELADNAETEKRLKKEREEIRIHQLPEMMFELEIPLIGVGNNVVEIEDMIQASFPKEDDKIKSVCDWLVDNKEGGGIKRQLALDLPKGDAVTEQKVIDAIQKVSKSLKPAIRPTIHHATYTALCKKLIRSGKPIPKDLLGIFVGHIARVRGIDK